MSLNVFRFSSYGEYIKSQTEINNRKQMVQYCTEIQIAYLSGYLRGKVRNLRFGLCHGTRKGNEQKWFMKYLGIEVLGTEISDTANKHANTIQWDFHEVKPEWVRNVSFIYSNAFDHSFDPVLCLNRWMSCLEEGGLCFLHWDRNYSTEPNPDQPFSATLDEYKTMVRGCGFKIVDELRIMDVVILVLGNK